MKKNKNVDMNELDPEEYLPHPLLILGGGGMALFFISWYISPQFILLCGAPLFALSITAYIFFHFFK